jgi:type IV secretion system protein VirD4
MRSEEWTKRAVIKRILVKDGAGPVLFHENGNAYVSTGEGHVMLLGTTASGKSRRGLIPCAMSIIKNHQSGVFVDPKGEIYKYTKDMISNQYEVHVIDFRKLYETYAEGWNPLSAPYRLWITGNPKDKHDAEQTIEDLAYTMFPEAKNADPFWINEGRALFIGVVYALFSYAKPEQINLASCYYLIANGEERYGASTYLKEFVKIVAKNEGVAMQLQSYVTTASETAGGIRSIYLDGLSQYARSEYIRKFLSHDELCINELKGDKPTLIYIIIPDEIRIYDHIVAAMCSQLMHHYIRIAEQDYNGSLPIRVNILLDELGNIGCSLKNTLPHLLTASRSRNIRCGLALQSLSQLEAVFGSENAQTIIGNCDVRITYRVNDYKTLSEFSQLLGNKEKNCDGHISIEPLITPSQLGAMETGQVLVMVAGRIKYITWLRDFTEMNLSQYRPAKTAVVKKRKASKYSYFDIQSFVKEKKSKMFQNNGEKRTFGSGSFEPFSSLFGKNEVKDNEEDISFPGRIGKFSEVEDIDELIRHIDEQIAEIEAEEAKENGGEENESE